MAKALVIAAPQSGSGKTILTLGLIRAFKNKGLRVVSAKIGPDYIDPGFHATASGSPCLNLDLWAMGETACRSILSRIGETADLVIIEGVMGLFDGPLHAKGSTADLAAAMDLPIVLVVDTSHQAQSVAAQVHGLRSFRPDVTVSGVILNRVKSDRHEATLREFLDIEVLGSVRQSDSLQLPSRHLGLVQAMENQRLEQIIAQAASTVTRETVLDSIFNHALAVPNQPGSSPVLPPLGQHIAIARDIAFAFSYPHMLDGWRYSGAQLSFFSPLANQAPAATADAIFLPGGYPELHAGKIAGNTRFLEGLRKSKALIYGECGGYMVLGQTLRDATGTTHAMAGLLPVETNFTTRKLHLGYRQLKPLAGPWKSLLRGHEFHYSTLTHQGEGQPLFDASDAAGSALGPMGLRIGNVLGSYAHIIAEAS